MYGAESTTGIGVYIKNLTDHLFLIDQKNDYFLFMNDPAYSNFRPLNNRVNKIKVNLPWYSWSEQIKLPKILLNYRLDLVHFPHFNAPVLYPKKFLLTIHDITPKFFPGPKVKKSAIRKFGYSLTINSALRRAKKIITVSNHTKENLVKNFLITSKKIETIYLGFDQSFLQVTPKNKLIEFKKKYQLIKPFIFYLGVWRDHKNLTGLIKAFEILKKDFNLNLQLVLGGKPDPAYPEILEAVKKSEFKNDIVTPGFIASDELPLFYQGAEAFILPSFCEGFGLVALESLACGTPVAASKTTSLPEMLGELALYFDPYDPNDIAKKIYQIVTDYNFRAEVKKNGPVQLKKFNWQTCAQKTLVIYEDIS
ncbi:MAG: hypothetical protein A2729_00850 [Candidatus Buchananbacteria bacterium RIFCSPHIGHO2_01_FULL_39_14]|uniref:Glycosyl transferase family 1 domain-containing protein n=1 Tax=Candidatus Buchananbacteria bacterium RIFCSPHIGHO2_01_FULL_39_14 TaxID=1797532 RepID=A0A1G1XUW0_9BACT|nr:MAG: hypothetical protein A2729_00850 [Candidatus Buchananbacteria bacterium RIFCSPHIGHO2_01_FULL_39_14]OGY49581.1 MAG: hypothetical protein A3D39_02105 [Candidatus Buchananbacteria bacterium RIFCSPHIGHO2_02_FULL_39_17]